MSEWLCERSFLQCTGISCQYFEHLKQQHSKCYHLPDGNEDRTTLGLVLCSSNAESLTASFEGLKQSSQSWKLIQGSYYFPLSHWDLFFVCLCFCCSCCWCFFTNLKMLKYILLPLLWKTTWLQFSLFLKYRISEVHLIGIDETPDPNLVVFAANHMLLLWLYVCYSMPRSCYGKCCICSVLVDTGQFLPFQCWLPKS